MNHERTTPEHFISQINEFRQKVIREKFAARLSEVKQEELVELVKLQAEVRARHLMAILDMVDLKVADVLAKINEARQFREMAEEMDISVEAIIAAILAKEITVPGLVESTVSADEIEFALEKFIKKAIDDQYVADW